MERKKKLKKIRFRVFSFQIMFQPIKKKEQKLSILLNPSANHRSFFPLLFFDFEALKGGLSFLKSKNQK